MPRTGWGIYLPNDGDPRVGEAMEIAGAGCYTLLHHQAGKNQAVKTIRTEYPDALIQIRCYCPNWYALTPARWAQDCWDIMHGGGDPLVRYTRHMTWANEQNLAAESGGVIGATASRLATWHDYQVIAAWNEAFVAAYRALPDTAADVLHYPGLAYGHGEDWGYDGAHRPLPGFPLVGGEPVPAYTVLAAGIALCPILNHHPYVQRGAPVLDEWVGVRRIEKAIALFPGKPIYAAETGQFDITADAAPDQLVAIGYYLQGRPEVVGWTPFVLDSPDPGHAMNNWSRNPRVAEAYRRATRLTKTDSWEVPTVPDWYPPAVRRPISVNYTAGRGGRLPTVLVDHIADGLGSPWAWFNTDRGDRGSSAHFWVSRAGKVEQYRPLGDTCWANGPIAKPDMSNAAVAAIVNEPVNPNRVSVAIEHEGHPGDLFPTAQIDASHKLHVWLGAQYKIPMTRAQVLGHYQFDSVTRANCPGAAHPWQAILGGSSVPDTEATLRDQAYALGSQLAALGPKFQAVGCPQTAEYARNQGQAIERTMVIQKGEK